MNPFRITRLTFYPLILLLIPLTAMQFSNEVEWSWFDFVIMGIVLLLLGLGISTISKSVKLRHKRYAYYFFIIAVFLILWAELAVGVFGSPFAGN